MAKVVTDSWVMGEVRDVKRSIAFYAKIGFKPSMQMPHYAEFKVPGGTVFGVHSMGPKKGVKKKGDSDGGWRIMLRVKGIRKLVATLKRKKIRCSAVKMAPGGAAFSSFKDPDGNRLTLVQMGRS